MLLHPLAWLHTFLKQVNNELGDLPFHEIIFLDRIYKILESYEQLSEDDWVPLQQVLDQLYSTYA